jgi:hypothetical protein
VADLSRLGAAGTPEPTSDLPPARPCWDTGPGEHSAHYWTTAGQRYWCPGRRKGYDGPQPTPAHRCSNLNAHPPHDWLTDSGDRSVPASAGQPLPEVGPLTWTAQHCPGLRHREAMALVQAQPPRSCQRRANAEPHPPHGWHPDGPDAPRVWCAGVRSVAGVAERLCFTSTPHPAHGWTGEPPYSACDPQEAPASREYRCPGIPVTSTFGRPPATGARKAPQGPESDEPIPTEPRVFPFRDAPALPMDDIRRAAELLSRRPVVMVRNQMAAERVHTRLGMEALGIQLVVNENVPEGKALIIDAGRLAERLEQWAQEPTYRTNPGPDVRGATAIIVTGL